MTEAEQERGRARDLERRLRALGFYCPPGTFEPLTDDAHPTRSPAAVETTSDRGAVGRAVMSGRIRRNFTPPKITVR
jgi:hypothetical protein